MFLLILVMVFLFMVTVLCPISNYSYLIPQLLLARGKSYCKYCLWMALWIFLTAYHLFMDCLMLIFDSLALIGIIRIFWMFHCIFKKLLFYFSITMCFHSFTWRGYPRGVMVKAMGCGIVVHEFVLQSRYYVHFRANTLGKGMNPLILPAIG